LEACEAQQQFAEARPLVHDPQLLRVSICDTVIYIYRESPGAEVCAAEVYAQQFAEARPLPVFGGTMASTSKKVDHRHPDLALKVNALGACGHNILTSPPLL
jgi:hypothetical protein